jgi:hypothetical protein
MYPDPRRAERLFAEQFSRDGDGYVYRRGRREPGIWVTAAERDGFVEDFNRKHRGSQWIAYAGVGLVMVSLVALAKTRPNVSFDDVRSSIAIIAACLVSSIPYAVRFRQIWNAPARALRSR